MRRRRRRRTHSFGYYTNMVQQIKVIINTIIQPLPALFFTQGQGNRSKGEVKDLEKNLLTRFFNLKNNFWISPIFYMKLPMSMDIT